MKQSKVEVTVRQLFSTRQFKEWQRFLSFWDSKEKWNIKMVCLLKSFTTPHHTFLPFIVHCELLTWSYLAMRSVKRIPCPRIHFSATSVYYGWRKHFYIVFSMCRSGQLAISTHREKNITLSQSNHQNT